MTEETKQAVNKWTEIGSKVVLAVILGLSAWTLSSLSEVRADIAVLKERTGTMQAQMHGMVTLEERVRQIESSRFTEDDGKRMEDSLDSLKADVAEMKGRLPASFPPSSTEKRLDAIESAIRELEKK